MAHEIAHVCARHAMRQMTRANWANFATIPLIFIGGGIGYAVGILLARLLGQKIFGFTPEPKLFLLFVVLVLASLITLLGSAYPLRRASQYAPAPILRGE